MVKNLIESFSKIFLQKTQNKKIHLISHYDADGITSAAIFSKVLERLQKQFSLKIVKQLSEEEIKNFPKDKIIVLLDLGSGSLNSLSKTENDILILDHHEPTGKPRENIYLANPHLASEYENLCTAELSYLFSKEISNENKDLAYLAIIGMIGDIMEKEITKTRKGIINDAELIVKKGLLLYPSTRPIDRVLEYSSKPFIPGVTGNSRGTFELLREAGIEKKGKSYKSLTELDEEEMKRIVTAIALRLPTMDYSELIGNLYLIKFFNKIEDAREVSAIINACSRMNNPETALMLCLGNSSAKKRAERIYFNYRQHIISGLKQLENSKKVEGKGYVIINAKDKVKDTIIGTLASILSFSNIYKNGTVIITMAYDNDKIKVSARIAGKSSNNSKNLKKLMEKVIQLIGGESGGHKDAAGCRIDKKNEERFLEIMRTELEYELIKV